jgi:osmoprotectant transport system permease protein
VLLKIELPLALPVILAGARTSLILNIGTATTGAVIGAGGLGVPIVSGLVRNNTAFVVEGAVAAAGTALLVDHLFDRFLRGRENHLQSEL